MHQPQEPAAPGSVRARRGTRAAVYAGVTAVALLIIFAARGFSREVGDAQLAGRFSLLPLLHSRTPQELALTWNGLTLHFARTMTPGVVGFESVGTSTDIVFQDGSRLRVAPGASTGGSISLTPEGSAGASSATVVVPFSLEGVSLNPPPGSAALAWRRAGRTFLLSLPSGGTSDPEAGTLTLPLAGAAAAVLQVQGVTPAARAVETPAAAARLPLESDMPDEGKLQAAVSTWTDAAWQGWSSSRYSAADSTWRLADGTKGFSEDIGVALLSESVARGQWQKMFPRWSDALSARQNGGAAPVLNFTTSAFVGGVKDFAAALQKSDDAAVASAAAALSQADPAVLLVANLVPLLVDHGSPDLVQKAADFLSGRSGSGADLPSAAGLAGDLLDYLRLVHPDDAMRGLLKQVVETRILPAVRNTDAGVFVESGSGTSDVRLDVTCGTLLVRAGTLLGSTLASAVGRGLIVSAVALSDDSGFLPRSLVLADGRVTGREGSIAPETLYPLLVAGARFVPRETPLAAQVGNGAWIWTSARLASASGTSDGVTLQLSYPQGVPYNLVLKGLRPFTLLKLHGIPWHSDPTYFKYSDGWSYDPGTRTLFMKITGRVDPEEVDISY